MYWRSIVGILGALITVAAGEQPLEIKSGLVMLRYGVAELENKAGVKSEIHAKPESSEADRRPTTIVLRQGETLRTREGAECEIVLPQAGTVKVEPKSAVRIPGSPADPKDTVKSSLELLGGKLFLSIDAAKLTKEKKEFKLKTPTTILAVKGTRFFAELGEEIETAGVHEGAIEIAESESGNTLKITSGRAAMSKPGAITKPRALTRGELEQSAIYDTFEMDFTPAERARRKFETSYEVHNDETTLHPDLINTETSVELATGTALKMTVLPPPDIPSKDVSAQTAVEIPMRLRSKPEGITFMARSTGGVRSFFVTGAITYRDRLFYFVGGTPEPFPEGVAPGEWVPFFVPCWEQENGNPESDVVKFTVKPATIQAQVDADGAKVPYVLEFSPIMVGSRPDK